MALQEEIQQKLKTAPEYQFLRDQDNIGLLVITGSHAYGTNIEGSDIDIRGVSIPYKRDLYIGKQFKTIEDNQTDTAIYPLHHFVNLLATCSPNIVEILGLKPEQYLYSSPFVQPIFDNKELFITRRIIRTFGGFANGQLQLLKFKTFTRGMENKINKIAMHFVRIYYMAIEVIATGQINTYREREHDILMAIRNGAFTEENGDNLEMSEEFFDIVDSLERQFKYAKNNTFLPEKPDMVKIDDLIYDIVDKFNS